MFPLQASALIPFTAHPSQDRNTEDEVNICDHLPRNTEYAKVRHRKGKIDVLSSPKINLGASTLLGSANLEIEGVGTKEHQELDERMLISLNPFKGTAGDGPACLRW